MEQTLAEIFARKHTHGNLLDLVLTTMPDITRVKLLPPIADHSGLLTTVHVAATREIPVRREVWDFRHENWSALKEDLKNTDWKSLLDTVPEEAANNFLSTILEKNASSHTNKNPKRIS